MAKFGNHNIGIDTFGFSGEGSNVYKKVGLDFESVLTKVKKIIK